MFMDSGWLYPSATASKQLQSFHPFDSTGAEEFVPVQSLQVAAKPQPYKSESLLGRGDVPQSAQKNGHILSTTTAY